MLVVLLGCGYFGVGYYESYDRKPDNEFSKKVKEEFGDAIYYQETTGLSNGVVQYTFLIREYSIENIVKLQELANAEIADKETKSTVGIMVDFSHGAQCAFSISNFSNSSLDNPDYDAFSNLRIGYLEFEHDSFWDDVSIYYSLSDIKKLRISDQLQEYADTYEVDWYQIWPGLEDVEVYATSDRNR